MNFVWFLHGASPGWRRVVVLPVLLLLAGCKREQIEVHTTPKEKPAPAHSMGAHSGTIARPQLEWKLPAGWRETGPGQMSLANFSITGAAGQEAQVTITPLALMTGRESMVVNMWREQVGLEALSEAEAQKQFQTVEVGGEEGKLFEISGKADASPPKRIVTAMVHRPDSSWFYKLSGDTSLVEAQRPAFLEFLRSIQIKDPSAPPPAAEAAPAGETTKVKWQVPPGWQEAAPGPMQVAKFVANGDGGAKAEISIAIIPGDGGGALANANRWRKQIGLEPIEAADLPKQTTTLEAGGAKVLVLDVTADDKKRRLIAASVPRGDSTWFYKLMGDESVVAREKETFLQFVQSAK